MGELESVSAKANTNHESDGAVEVAGGSEDALAMGAVLGDGDEDGAEGVEVTDVVFLLFAAQAESETACEHGEQK